MNYHEIAQNSKASQDKEELEELLKIIGTEIYGPISILEIGVDQGYLLDTWSQAFYHYQPFIYGIDIAEPKRDLNPHIKFIKGNSKESWIPRLISQLVPHLSVLFIDGDHMYEQVKKDFELYSPLVRKGGIVAFHDARITDNDTVEVYKFWNEIKHQYKHKEIFSPTGTGVGVLWL